jgi:hypothetical protein
MDTAYDMITEMMHLPLAEGPLLIPVRPRRDMTAHRPVTYAECSAFARAVATAAPLGPTGSSGRDMR